MSQLPWYKDGLQFQCTQCGKCCTGQKGFVWVSQEEIQEMAEQLGLTVQAFKMRYIKKRENQYALVERKTKNQEYACVFLQGKQCMVYQARPKQCQTFPWWPENLTTKDSWQQAAKSCEGINTQAPTVSFIDIKKNIEKSGA